MQHTTSMMKKSNYDPICAFAMKELKKRKGCAMDTTSCVLAMPLDATVVN